MFLEGILGVIAASGAIIAVKTTVVEYWAWRARRDLQAKKVLDALAGPDSYEKMYQSQKTYPHQLPYPNTTTTTAASVPMWIVNHSGSGASGNV